MNKLPEINPWRSTLRVPVRELYISESKGSRMIDTGNRASIYFDQDTLQFLMSLPQSSKDMFFYIAQYLSKDKETVELRYEKYHERTGLSRDTFLRAIKGLTNVLLIPKATRKDVYFVNPAVLFKGDRVAKYREKLVIEHQDKRVLGMRKLGIIPELDESFNLEAAQVDEELFNDWE
jgi:hypothetical protein